MSPGDPRAPISPKNIKPHWNLPCWLKKWNPLKTLSPENTCWDTQVIHCKHNLFIVKKWQQNKNKNLSHHWWRKCQYPQAPAYKHGYITYTKAKCLIKQQYCFYSFNKQKSWNAIYRKNKQGSPKRLEPTASFWNHPHFSSFSSEPIRKVQSRPIRKAQIGPIRWPYLNPHWLL